MCVYVCDGCVCACVSMCMHACVCVCACVCACMCVLVIVHACVVMHVRGWVSTRTYKTQAPFNANIWQFTGG